MDPRPDHGETSYRGSGKLNGKIAIITGVIAGMVVVRPRRRRPFARDRRGGGSAQAGCESLDNLTPADIYFGRAEAILLERERIKRQTIANRRLQHQLHAA